MDGKGKPIQEMQNGEDGFISLRGLTIADLKNGKSILYAHEDTILYPNDIGFCLSVVKEKGVIYFDKDGHDSEFSYRVHLIELEKVLIPLIDAREKS